MEGGGSLDSPLAAREETQFLDTPAPVAGAEYWLLAISRDGSDQWFGPVTVAAACVPRALTLERANPNPFTTRTTLSYSLPCDGLVELAVFDALGRRLAVLVNEDQPAGTHTVAWDGRNSEGDDVAAGVYWARIEAGGQSTTRQIVLKH